ncbi:hypothetical protein F5Y16DRAFT_416057 [Xylariaceae sp. FL0255]|nr:hypothetical protein F5Y16DRAFT_416057 [Xylariaceae sp. FL0255]
MGEHCVLRGGQKELRLSTPKIPDEFDENSQLAVDAWRKRLEHVPLDKEKETAGLPWDEPGYDAPKKFSNKNGDESNTAIPESAVVNTNSQSPNNDMLTGDAVVGLLIVSSDGSLSMSPDDQSTIIWHLAEGSSYVAGLEPAADVTFIFDTKIVTIPGDKQVPKVSMGDGLAGATFSGSLYRFFQGKGGSSSQLCYSRYDGTKWYDEQVVPSASTGAAMAAVEYNNELLCFHHGGASSTKNQIWFNRLDSKGSWKGEVQAPGSTTDADVSVVVYQKLLYLFH